MHLKRMVTMGLFAFTALLGSVAIAQTQAGAIKGTVTDSSTGVPLLLVTVVATSPALQGQQSEFTDASGQYFMSTLPPGTYSLLFIYGDAKIKRENVEVGVGKETVANVKINTQSTGEVITIKEKAPTIDSGSTKQGSTIQQDYLKHVPNRGRTWSGVLGAAAGSQGDAFGTSFSGSTSIENNYVVDGVNTSGVSLGAGFPTQGSQVINNFIQEIEVITGGYNAEFGRSTGGVVNVVTKTGSNDFHGSVFGNYVAFNAANEDIRLAGSSIQYLDEQPNTLDFGFELGGPIVKDKVWFYVGFAPLFQSNDRIRKVSTRVDRNVRFANYDPQTCTVKNKDGSCNNDASRDPEGLTHPTGHCELEAAPIPGVPNACESDSAPDLDPALNTAAFEEISRRTDTDKLQQYQFTGKLNFAVTPEHQGQISLNGTYGRFDGYRGPAIFGTPTFTNSIVKSLTTDVAAKWTSKLFDNKTQIDVIAGWHRNKQDSDPITETLPGDPTKRVRDLPTTRFRNVAGYSDASTLGAVGRNADTPEAAEVLQFCTEGDPSVADPFPTIQNCPTPTYGLFSPFTFQDSLEQRYSGKATVTQRVKAMGHHQLKGGVDFESNILDDDRNNAGGAINDLFSFGANLAVWDVSRFVGLGRGNDVCGFNDDGTPKMCEYLDHIPVHANTYNYGAFAQDSWSILPNLTVNAGLRYEQQYLQYSKQLRGFVDPATGDHYGNNALELKDLVAPRLGVIYDWTKEGRSKIYASWGRFYESIPLDIQNRAFGGEVTLDTFWDWDGQCGSAPTGTSDKTTLRVPSLGMNCPRTPTADPATSDEAGSGSVPVENDLTGGTASVVMPGTKAQYIDEFVAGVEYEVLEDLRMGLSYQNRRTGSVIEDMSSDGAQTYFIGNPGEFSEDAEADLLNEIHALPMGNERRDVLISRLNSFQLSRTLLDKATRDYNAIQLTASKRFSRAFMVQGSYTYSTLRGNYPGLFSPDKNQNDPNITSQYDLFEFLANRCCKLPFDRPHQFKLDGYYTFDLQEAGRITTGARLRFTSGIPLTAFGGNHPVYGANESFLLPRGAEGRTPFASQADLHVAYGRKLGKMDLEVYFELFNVLNNQYATQQDRGYTSTGSDPVVGGAKEDLAYIKATNHLGGGINTATGYSNTPVRNVNFLQPTFRNTPLSGRFGVNLSF